MPSVRTAAHAIACISLGGALVPISAIAQTALPGIVVTSPSPVAKPAPQRALEPAPVAQAPAQKAAPMQASTVPTAPPVIVTSTGPLPGTIIVVDDAFVPITVVTGREIAATQGATITDTLQTKLGISGSTFAAGASRPIIRGLDNNRVRVQENGIGSHDVSALSEDHAVPIDPNAATQVEVVRGPATLRYGSQTIGGVVSVINNRIPEFVPRGGFQGEIKGGYSSVDRSRDGSMSATAGAGNFVVHADGFNRQADDYNTPRGRQTNTFIDSDGFSVGGSYVWRDGFVGVSFTRFNSLYGIPGVEATLGQTRIDMTQDKVMSKGEWRVRSNGIEAIRFWYGTTDYKHNELGFDAGTGADFIGSQFKNKEQEGRVEIQHMPVMTSLGELRGAVGIQMGHRKTSGISFEGDNLLDPARTQSIAGFWFEELQLTQKLRLQAAMRIEETKVRGLGLADITDPNNPIVFDGERKFMPFSASLGGLYELPMGVVARLTGQYVERAPDAAELYSKGAHEATGTFEIGNPFLTKEVATTIELGFKRAKGDLRFDASAFYSRYQGFIFKRLTGEFCDDNVASCTPVGAGSELKQLLFEQRDATFYGVELGAQYDVAPIWRGVWGIEGQYDFVRAKFEGVENVPRIPPHRLGGGLFYRDGTWLARVGLLHAFKQDKLGINETETAGYNQLSAELSYTQRFNANSNIAQQITVGIKGENLLDEEVRNHVSFKKDDVLQPGVGVRLFGSIKFN